MIRRFFHGLILFSFLLSHAEWSQWVRVPVLIHHFVEHQSLASDSFSWEQFIQMHYEGNMNHPDDAHGDHEKLPFLTYHALSPCIPLGSPLSNVPEPILLALPSMQRFVHSLSIFLPRDLSSVWHPPMG